MIVLDTTVLVYAVGVEHPLRTPCRELIAAVQAGEIRATTTAEVIQEFAHVRARRRGRDDAARVASDYAELFAPLLVVGDDDVLAGLELFGRCPRMGAFDCVLAATAARHGAAALVSADRALAEAEGVAYLDPATAGFLDGVGGGSG